MPSKKFCTIKLILFTKEASQLQREFLDPTSEKYDATYPKPVSMDKSLESSVNGGLVFWYDEIFDWFMRIDEGPHKKLKSRIRKELGIKKRKVGK